MGYDCSLHLIDETFTREVLVPGLFGDDSKARRLIERAQPAMTTYRGGAAALVKQIREKLREVLAGGRGDVGEGLQKTVFFGLGIVTGHERPVFQARGFSFSFLRKAGLEELSKEIGSPQVLLQSPDGKPLRDVPKDLFPLFVPPCFFENYCAGGYVPAASVPALRKKVRKFAPRFARRLEEKDYDAETALDMLLGALEDAEAGKFGILELTDVTGFTPMIPSRNVVRRGLGRNPSPTVMAEVDAACGRKSAPATAAGTAPGTGATPAAALTEDRKLALLAYVGDRATRKKLGAAAPLASEDPLAFLSGLLEWGRDALYHALVGYHAKRGPAIRAAVEAARLRRATVEELGVQAQIVAVLAREDADLASAVREAIVAWLGGRSVVPPVDPMLADMVERMGARTAPEALRRSAVPPQESSSDESSRDESSANSPATASPSETMDPGIELLVTSYTRELEAGRPPDATAPREHLALAIALKRRERAAEAVVHFREAFKDASIRGDVANPNLYTGAAAAALASVTVRGLDGVKLRREAYEWLAEHVRLVRSMLEQLRAGRRGEGMFARALEKRLEHARRDDPELEVLRGGEKFEAIFGGA